MRKRAKRIPADRARERRTVGGRLLAAALTAALGALPCGGELMAWGLEGHRIVTAEAAARVPPDAGSFFRRHSDRLQELSLEPDTVLKARDRKERTRHYINLELLDDPPFDSVPRDREEAGRRYGERRLSESGTLPWRILKVFGDLRSAMRGGDTERILKHAGYLAHYAGDLFQPLHLTRNHDGQETCNHGIHAAFEAEMIERRPDAYREAVARGRGAAEAIRRPPRQVFEWMRATYPLIEPLLDADTSAIRLLKSESRDYYDSMDRLAGPIAERQMSAAANAVASLWYTAWIDAGKPDLR